MAKIRVLLLAGGRSGEHEISIISARSVLRACEGGDLDITPLVITKTGRWLGPDASRLALTDGVARDGGELVLHSAKSVEPYDVVFPLLHGPNGEDGTVQGMLELADVPYVGSGVLASAVCMDKPMAKDVFLAHGLPQVDYRTITSATWRNGRESVLARCCEMPAPWFVKPANLGSSVGISRATTRAELEAAIDAAFCHDRRVIVERGVVGARELEVAILGNDVAEASPVGEILYDAPFYDYETKYTEGRARLHIPADIPNDVAHTIQELGKRAFQLTDCAGFARVDFFYQAQSGDVLLNEINTMPGFTPFSMFSKLWEAAGISYAELVKRLVDLAMERHRSKAQR